MKRKKRTRLRACLRWGVWMCTGLLVVAIPVSFLFEPGVMVTKRANPSGAAINYYSLDIIDGRLLLRSFHPEQYRRSTQEIGETVWDIRLRTSGYFIWTPNQWWGWPQVLKDPSFPTLVDLPLVYMLVVGAFASVFAWLLNFRHWLLHVGLDAVRCRYCGYSLEGLTSDVCPECGERIDGETNA